jgi:hypothetical protein
MLRFFIGPRLTVERDLRFLNSFQPRAVMFAIFTSQKHKSPASAAEKRAFCV